MHPPDQQVDSIARNTEFAVAVRLSGIGIIAAAIGTDVAYALYVAAHLRLCRDVAGLRLRPLVAPFRSLAAAAAMALVLLVFGTGEIALPLVVVSGALGTAMYAGILLVTPQITMDELTGARSAVAAPAATRGPAEAWRIRTFRPVRARELTQIGRESRHTATPSTTTSSCRGFRLECAAPGLRPSRAWRDRTAIRRYVLKPDGS